MDVLVGFGLLAPEKLDDWRYGRIPYLEQIIDCNLTRLSRLLRILGFLMLMTSILSRRPACIYSVVRLPADGFCSPEERRRQGIGHAWHFVWPGKGPFHPPVHYEKIAE